MNESFDPRAYDVEVASSLESLAPGVYAWLHDEADHDNTNVGVVVAEDGLTVIDAGLTRQRSALVANSLAELSPRPTRRLVLTGSHIDLVGGSTAFPLAAVYGSAQTSAHLDQPANPDSWSRLYPRHAEELQSTVTRPVTHTVEEPAHLCPASIAVPAAGTQFVNLVVQVPSANVLFMGAVATFGVIPLGFEADIPAWIESLDTMTTLGDLFVPSHGPIGGVEEVHGLRDYLLACVDAKGEPSKMAAGPWDAWSDQRFTPINIERAAMLATGDPSPPPSMLALVGMG